MIPLNRKTLLGNKGTDPLAPNGRVAMGGTDPYGSHGPTPHVLTCPNRVCPPIVTQQGLSPYHHRPLAPSLLKTTMRQPSYLRFHILNGAFVGRSQNFHICDQFSTSNNPRTINPKDTCVYTHAPHTRVVRLGALALQK